MADRSNHYEAAFEDYLRSRGCPYIAVDEAKKAIFAAASVKSFDFLVYSATGPNMLADVKGRKFPSQTPGRQRGASRAWENWITRQDAHGLMEWEKVFGEGFSAVLVFAYWLQGSPQRSPFEDVHWYKKNHYAFLAVRLSDYLSVARQRSAKWQTLGVPAKTFTEIVGDVAGFL